MAEHIYAYLPRPAMSPLGDGRSVYALPVAGAPLWRHIAAAHAAHTDGAAHFVVADPALQRDAGAMEAIAKFGATGTASPDGAALEPSAGGFFPSRDGRRLPLELPWQLLDVMQEILSGVPAGVSPDAEVEPGVEISGNVRIEAGAHVFGGARIKGDVYIGANVVVGNGALIRGATSIAADGVAGFSAEVKNSLLGEACGVGPLAFVADSLLERNCFLGGTARISNYRLDGADVAMEIDGRRRSTGRRQFGAVLGPAVRVGIGAVLYPGRKIGANCLIGPGVNVTRNLDPDLRVEIRQELDIRALHTGA